MQHYGDVNQVSNKVFFVCIFCLEFLVLREDVWNIMFIKTFQFGKTKKKFFLYLVRF